MKKEYWKVLESECEYFGITHWLRVPGSILPGHITQVTLSPKYGICVSDGWKDEMVPGRSLIDLYNVGQLIKFYNLKNTLDAWMIDRYWEFFNPS